MFYLLLLQLKLTYGYEFLASPPGVFNETCYYDGTQNPACGNTSYWNITTASGTPQIGDEIRTGPNGTSSPLAAVGKYSYNCVETGFGNRRYFDISADPADFAIVPLVLPAVSDVGAC